MAFLYVGMVGCKHSLKNDSPNDLKNETQASMYSQISIYADYPSYKNAEEIVNAASNIYIGTVRDISFEIIDMVTGKVDNLPQSLSTSRMLYTIYTVSVTDSIKGDNPLEIKIRVMGGIVGYNEKNQYEKLELSGLLDCYPGIPVISGIEDKCSLAIDGEYLFCTSRIAGDDYDFVINLNQFAHNIDSDNAKAIISLCK